MGGAILQVTVHAPNRGPSYGSVSPVERIPGSKNQEVKARCVHSATVPNAPFSAGLYVLGPVFIEVKAWVLLNC